VAVLPFPPSVSFDNFLTSFNSFLDLSALNLGRPKTPQYEMNESGALAAVSLEQIRVLTIEPQKGYMGSALPQL